MNPYGHGLWKKMEVYLYHPGRELMSTGALLTPPNFLANYVAVFPEVASRLNSCVECTAILNDITQDNNKVLGDNSNKTVKLHRLDRIMEESVYKFQSVVEAGQQNSGPHKKYP